jgi:predicted nucleotidyltransferase
MDSLRRLALELSIPERTLRRAAREGLVRGDRVSPRRFRTTLREEVYLRSYWDLLSRLREAFRTEPNVELAVLFGSTATGRDHDGSDIDVLVGVTDPGVGRLAEMAERLSRRLGREVQVVRLADAEQSPVLMDDILRDGRVIADRGELWERLSQAAGKWQRLARRAERSRATVLSEQTLDASIA